MAQKSGNIKKLLKVTSALAFACLITGIIGFAIGVNHATGGDSIKKMSLGLAGILGIIAIIINAVGAVIVATIR